MLGIVIIAHGRMAEEFRLTLDHIMGPQKGIATVNVGADDDLASTRADTEAAIAAVDTGCGVVVITDILGATPGNVARTCSRRDVVVIGGANIPVLLGIVQARRTACDIKEIVGRALATGHRHLVEAVCPERGMAPA